MKIPVKLGNAKQIVQASAPFEYTVCHDNEGDVLWHPDQIANLTFPRISEKSSPPPPELWVCSDTYWTWSVQDGVRYYQRGIPAGYE